MDCMTRADLDYSLEACTYVDLRKRPEFADLFPEYYGSWTFSRPTDRPGQSHPVRMNLLGTADGETMSNIIANSLPQGGSQRPRHFPKPYGDVEVRLSVLRQLIELDNSLWWNAMIWVTDLGPSGVMLSEEGKNVKLMDFTGARLYRWYDDIDHPNYYPKHDTDEPQIRVKPQSPIQKYWPLHPSSDNFLRADGPFRDWIPETWIANPALAAQWLIQTFGSSSEYRPPSEYFLNPERHRNLAPSTFELLMCLRNSETVR